LWLFNKVLGAFWYFLSIQRETACWHAACKNHTRCTSTSFNCNHPLSDLAFLNDYCQPIEKPNATFFDFGIFLGALQSGNLESTDFPQKLAYCFWWGLRNLRFGRDHTLDLLFNNSLSFLFFSFLFFFFFFFFFLYFEHIYCIIVIYIAISYIHDTFSNFRSSFGQNLQTSSYFWENFFAISVSIFALLLFLYFIGNVQVGARSTSVLGFRALDYIFIYVQHYIYRWFRSIYM
jgi:hypothetical protein